MKTSRTAISGCAASAPARNATKVLRIEGRSIPPTRPSLLRLAHARAEKAGEVGRLLELEHHRRHVRAHGVARGGDEDRIRELGADLRGGILILESVSEHEREAALGEIAKAFLELGRGARLDVADIGAELVADGFEPGVGARVPAAVGDRARREQGHAKNGCVLRATAARELEARGEPAGERKRKRRGRPAGPSAHGRASIGAGAAFVNARRRAAARGAARDVEVAVFAEDLERLPAGHLGHARHAGGHGTGRIDHPRIVGLLEPERDHVMLPVRAPEDDRAVHLVFTEAETAQQVVAEQLEAVAVVAVAAEGLVERGPAIDRTVRDVVALRDVLDPRGDLARLGAAPYSLASLAISLTSGKRPTSAQGNSTCSR